MEGDKRRQNRAYPVVYFYPRPHMEGDAPGGPLPPLAANFYPRPHMEGDRFLCLLMIGYFDFYPRPHMEGD